MDKENFQKPESASNSNSSARGSNFPSVTHPASSFFSQNKEDLFRRLRSGKDILCTLPTRLDPNIQFSEDEDSAEIKNEKPEKTPSLFRSTSCQLPSLKMGKPLLGARKVHQTPTIRSASADRVRKPFPASTPNLNCQGERKNQTPKPPSELPSKPTLPEATIVINQKPYSVLSFLGSGGSCKVYSVYDPGQKNVVAVKCVDLKSADKEIRKGYEKEIEYLKLLKDSKNVIRMFDYQYLEHELFIVLEKGEIDLAKYLSNEVKNRSLTPLKIKFYWAQMLEAVSEIHKHGIVHSDLKPANFLLVEGRLKLIDFGIAALVPDDSTSAIRDTHIGTLNYMSPEAVTHTSKPSGDQACFKVSVKSDVWSLGCILYNLVYGKTPFQDIRNVWAKIHAITSPDHLIEFKDIPDRLLLDVMKKCLERNPKVRASVDQLLQHPYLAEKEASQSKDLESALLQQMQGLTPRRMTYLSRVVQQLKREK